MRVALFLGGLLLVIGVVLQASWPRGAAEPQAAPNNASASAGEEYAGRIGLGRAVRQPARPSGAPPRPTPAARRQPWSAPAEFAPSDPVR